MPFSACARIANAGVGASANRKDRMPVMTSEMIIRRCDPNLRNRRLPKKKAGSSLKAATRLMIPTCTSLPPSSLMYGDKKFEVEFNSTPPKKA